MNSGNDITVDVDIGRKQTQSARGVAAVGGTAGLFVEAGGDHHQFAAFEIVVIAVAKINRRATEPRRTGCRRQAPAIAFDYD